MYNYKNYAGKFPARAQDEKKNKTMERKVPIAKIEKKQYTHIIHQQRQIIPFALLNIVISTEF